MPKLKYKQYFTQKNVVKENKWGGEGIGLAQVPDAVAPPGAWIAFFGWTGLFMGSLSRRRRLILH